MGRVPVQAQRLSTLNELLAGFLASKRSVATRDAYRADLQSWVLWCDGAGVEVLAAGIHHADVYLRALADPHLGGDPRTGRVLAPSSIGRRASAIHGFYRYAARQPAVTGSPFTGALRPATDDESMTSGLSPDEVRALIRAARTDSPRSEALITLLALNGLRISEAVASRIEDLDTDRGHRVLRVRRKGGKRAKIPLTPAAIRSLNASIVGRTSGPAFATSTGKALDRSEAWRLLRRLAKNAGIPGAERISPHSMRHTYATTALDAGVPLRDVQDSMGHTDPRTTRLYDRSRDNLDRNATYAVAAVLADD
ncbi:site-specific tyrosine recombinase XerD [Kineosporia mesophila]|uniref:Site-specific tyrosine recombinase XerD n=1 Tax=Kineosporia mesophila TaxID=566012 RepID=A0ABP6ZR97_9ACTN|nr:tyrosine-type recombinase/integrase [Kineosporia mesophila]MCD5353714.1 tyrosine-type recombinase/integrase [Kineosporia mesophila]